MENLYILKQYNLILIRYGEIWLKSQKVKIRMLKILINNIKRKLKKKHINFHKYQLSKDSSRVLFFFKNEDIIKALDVLKNVFGIYSVSPALRTSNRIENICERSLEVAQSILRKNDTFAVRVKRSGKHDYTSMDVAKIVGKAILDVLPNLTLKVNLSSPKKVIFIEVRDEFSYIFTDIIKSNWGGLPIEIQKKILAMDVGRVNDLIAGFLLMRRGCTVYPVLFKMTKNHKYSNIWISNWKIFAQFIPYSQLILKIVNLSDILKIIEQNIPNKRFLCGICKLLRLEILSKLAEPSNNKSNMNFRAITDGISLNQSTSCPDYIELNTLALFSDYPVFTPIIGLSLSEINDIKNLISSELRAFDYCRFKPKDQDFSLEQLKKVYHSLELNDIINQYIHNIKEIKI